MKKIPPPFGFRFGVGGEDKATIGGARVPYPHGPSQARGHERRPATFYTKWHELEAKRAAFGHQLYDFAFFAALVAAAFSGALLCAVVLPLRFRMPSFSRSWG